MKIFLTGATGFLGKNIVDRYQDATIFKFQRGGNLDADLFEFAPDVIINCAAEIKNFDNMWSNISITSRCLEYVKRFTNTKMIQIGSSSEYGAHDTATNEESALRVYDLYSSTKASSSLLCQAYGKQYGLKVTVLRPYSLFGQHEMPPRMFPNLWRSFIKNHPIKLVNGMHDFCYVDDFIDAIDIVINSKDNLCGEVFNISNGEQYTNFEICELFRQITNLNGNVELIDDFVTPRVWLCDNRKAKNVLGWVPKNNIHSGIRSFIRKATYE